MAVNILRNRQYCVPSSAVGELLTLPGSSWANTSYVELGTVDTDSILTGVVVRPIGVIFNAWPFEVDIAAGGVVIATIRGYLQEVFASVGSGGLYFQITIPVDAIPDGASISARIRAATTSTPSVRVSVTYLKKPLSGTLLTTANPLKCSPSAATSLSVITNASAWANGTPVSVFDASGPARVLVGMTAKIDVAGIESELDILTGPSDTVAMTLRLSGGGVSSFPNYIPLQHPLTILALTRVRVRARCESSELTMFFAVSYFEMPL